MTEREYHYTGADWCGPCNQVKSTDAFHKARIELPFEYHDVDEDKKFAQKHNVRSLPTLLVLEDGDVVTERTGVSDVVNELRRSLQ